jgi:hypothetical protein
MDAGGGGRVEAGEETVEPSGAAGFGRGEAGAQHGVAAWRGGEPVERGAEVEAGSAGEDGQASAGGDFAKDGAGEGSEPAGVAGSESQLTISPPH